MILDEANAGGMTAHRRSITRAAKAQLMPDISGGEIVADIEEERCKYRFRVYSGFHISTLAAVTAHHLSNSTFIQVPLTTSILSIF